MEYEDGMKKLEKESRFISKNLAGKKVEEIEFPIGYPGHFDGVIIKFEGGMQLELHEGVSGCQECDPDGLGNGVSVSFKVKK